MSSTSERRAIRHHRVVDWWAGAWRWVLMAFGAVTATYLLLERGSQGGAMLAVVLAAFVVAAALTGSKPLAIVLFSVPGLLISQRIGVGGADLSVSDAALAAAFGAAVLLGERPYSRSLRQLLVLNLVYQFATFFTLLVNPYLANTMEWFHAWLLVSGALIVGWALGAAGFARTALSLIVFTACVIAVLTLIDAATQYLAGNFGPAAPSWPIPMHKNFVGTVFAFGAIIAFLNPDWVGWTRGWSRLAFWLLIAGLLVSQSRQALIGLMAAVIVAVIRRSTSRRSRYLIAVLLIPAAWLIISMVVDQVQSQNQHNSVFQRLDWFREVYRFWRESPVFGHGLRYWYQPGNLGYQPPQGELEVLASSGVVGLIGFAVMCIGILLVLWHMDPRYGTLAFAIVLSRFVQAQFDLFWVAAQVSIPFVVAGICIGAMAREERANAEAAIGPPLRAGRPTAPIRLG
ncbi:O-antigen ligase family protein [Agromyces aurantiacus]|uniref:O-antigen ligase family protein n=1 Tax=Agromyces aurantiacus TaxID=165814 RepID=A0ABV9R262_9MICO|nr:O-antigen ligase family protein [Agromyces aurantiacus]MBM7502742.1 O-antigen ligase [Agromyces aurantiacus]